MKKRILSFFLVFATLLSVFPLDVSAAEASESPLSEGESAKRITSFYDYYVTDGLVAFYDAYDTANGTFDLEGGKWYAKLYNATSGMLEKTSDAAYTATIGGGVYSETNPTGWVKGEKGISYFTNTSVGSNKIRFPVSLLSANESYTVEYVGRVDLREVHDATQETGSVDKTTTDGMTTYTVSGLTTLVRNTSTYYTNLCYYTVTLKGEANAKVDFKVNDADVTVTLDAQGNGTYMAKCDAKLDTYVIVAPEAVELTFSKDKTLNSQYMSASAFVFGTLHCMHWTNKLGNNNWGNGAGNSRWYTGSADWNVHNGNASNSAYGGSYKEASIFVDYNGQVTAMRIEKSKLSTGESYAVTYGDKNFTVSGKKAFADYKFDILSNTCGAAYALRIYSRYLTDDEKKSNAFADKMLYNGVDFDAFNTLSDSLKAMYIKSTESLELTAGVEAFTEVLSGVIDFAEKEASIREMTDYDKLYVGADGEKTANGGSLIALFSAYGSNTASVDFQNKSWRAKVGNVDAVLMGDVYDSATKKGYWQLRPEGGFGYDIGLVGDGFGAAKYTVQTSSGGVAYMQGTVDATYTGAANTYLQLDPSLISTPDFTVEYIVRYPYLKVVENGEFVGEVTKNLYLGDSYSRQPTETVGLLKNCVPRVGSIDQAENAPRVIRWYVTAPSYGWSQAGYNAQLWNETSRTSDGVFTQTVTRDETALALGGAEATYRILKDANVMVSGEYSTDNSTSGTLYFVGDAAAGQSFRLFQQVSVTAYSLRVYDTVLTVAEMQQNRVIDLAAYCGADLTAYKALTPEAREIANSMLAGNAFTTDQAEFEAALKTVTDILGGEMDLAESLYVTDGLSVLLSAYQGFETPSSGGGDSAVTWIDGVTQNASATLRGEGWTKNENGGFTIVKNWDDFNKDTTFGLYLDQALLPEGSYTVELVANPVGITNEDGTRFIDDFSTYGQNYNNGFAIGPMRCLQFVCYRPTGKDGQLEKRWLYQKEPNAWAASGYRARWTDTSWQDLGLEQIVSMSISLDLGADLSSAYSFRQDNVLQGTVTIPAAEYLKPSDTDGMFRLMVGVAGTIYACRVYNRPLTNAELQHNHFIDLAYYCNADLTAYKALSEEDRLAVDAVFAGGAFSTDTEAFEATLATVIDSLGENTEFSGVCGENLTWSLNTDSGVLTITGTGAMADYSPSSPASWHFFRSSIRTLVLAEGVTSIGYSAFASCSNLTSVTIPQGVTDIGNYAFEACSALRVVYLDSPTVAKKLTSQTSCGYLINHAQTVVLPSSVTTVGSYVTSSFSNSKSAIVGGKEATIYANHSHAIDNAIWQDGAGAKICVTCSLAIDDLCAIGQHFRPVHAPLCEDTYCTLCYADIFAYTDHTRPNTVKDCEDSSCIYCSKAMPALTSHSRPDTAADCEDTSCAACGTALSPIADHNWNEWECTSALSNTGSATVKRVCKSNPLHTETKTVSAPRVVSANLNISTDITLKYNVTIPEGCTDAYAVFTFNGTDYTVRKYTIDALGRYIFAFTGITPQCLGDNVKVTVYATYEGATLGAVKDNYSVKAYCENQLRKYADDEKLVRMVSDLLAYGAASQIYLDYKTDSLVTDGLAISPSVCPTLPSSLQQKGLHGTADANVKWKSVGLRYTNTTTVFFRFTAADLDGLTVKVTLGDRVAVYHAEDFKAEGNNVYRIDFNGVLATEFDETVTATFEKDGVVIGQYATYSVNSYLYTNQASANTALADLVKATYNYGKSARVYTGLDAEEEGYVSFPIGQDPSKDDIEWEVL